MPAAAVHLELVFSRPETTLAVTRGAARLMADMGYAPLLEVCLPNGRRADVMALGPKGEIVICEVKSGIEDFRSDRKWGEYAPFCDAFYFAVAPEFPLDVLPNEPGLIVADGFGGAVVRESNVTGTNWLGWLARWAPWDSAFARVDVGDVNADGVSDLITQRPDGATVIREAQLSGGSWSSWRSVWGGVLSP